MLLVLLLFGYSKVISENSLITHFHVLIIFFLTIKATVKPVVNYLPSNIAYCYVLLCIAYVYL